MLFPRKLVILNGRTFAECLLNQCFTQKTHDIKLTHICLMSTLINAPPRKLAIKRNEHLPNVYFNQRSTPKTRDIK